MQQPAGTDDAVASMEPNSTMRWSSGAGHEPVKEDDEEQQREAKLQAEALQFETQQRAAQQQEEKQKRVAKRLEEQQQDEEQQRAAQQQEE